MQSDYFAIAEALSNYAARACVKLRRQGSVARHISVSLQTNRFKTELPQYYNQLSVQLINPSDDIRRITQCAKYLLKKIFRHGYAYKKVTILLDDLSPRELQQGELFNPMADATRMKSQRLMQAIDSINQRYGRDKVKLAAEGIKQAWAMRRQLMSPCYTTRWHQLPIVRLK